jgi:hypothetical protein
MLALTVAIGCLVSIASAQLKQGMTIIRPQLVTPGQKGVRLRCILASLDKIRSNSKICKFIMPGSEEITVSYRNGSVNDAKGVKGQASRCKRQGCQVVCTKANSSYVLPDGPDKGLF